MAKKETGTVAAYKYLRRTFPISLDTEMPKLFAMWILEDLQKDFSFSLQQVAGIAEEVIKFFTECPIESPQGTLSHVIDTILNILYEDELFHNLNANDAFDFIIDILLHQKELIYEQIEIGGI